MRYGSVCSGIEAASAAWQPLGWECAWVSEIDPFASAVLAHHYPEVPNRGDFTAIDDPAGSIDLLVGGTPCQSFSVAGQRAGLDDPRGDLTLEYLRLAGRLRPRWLVWENVPGVLSIDGGRTFGAILGALAQLGYGFAYRVLDAQYFGVPQRRRRVFLVGYLGDWRLPAAVLFERHCLSGHPAPRREAGQGAPRPLAAGSRASSGYRLDADTAENLVPVYARDVAPALTSNYGKQADNSDTGLGPMLVAFDWQSGGDVRHNASEHHTSALQASQVPAVCGHLSGLSVALRGRDGGATAELGGDVAGAIRASQGGGDKPHVLHYTHDYNQDRIYGADGGGHAVCAQDSNRARNILDEMTVRRLTPRECERLQGFEDDWTLVPYRGKLAADGPRYRAIGNSMAVPVMRWIGERIALVEAVAR